MAKAGITVLGGMTVLSATWAQSLIIVNFPWKVALEIVSGEQHICKPTTIQFFPITTWLPIVAASTTEFAPI